VNRFLTDAKETVANLAPARPFGRAGANIPIIRQTPEKQQMKIVVTSNGGNLEAPASPLFGRCPVYIFVDTDTWQFEAVDNPALSAAGGAGIQAAQYVIEQGAEAALTGHVGPNAFNIFQAAQVPVYLTSGGTVRQAVEAFLAGRLPFAGGATVGAHAGMGAGRGRGLGRGRGMGMTPPAGSSVPPPAPRAEEIATLRQMASELRKQLAGVVDRIEKLEKGE
jgi:predicted Fe-Mo cluster-binding NifX family protein